MPRLFFVTLFLLLSALSPTLVSAQGDRVAENLQCKINIYRVFRNSSLPYANSGTLVPSGTRTNFDNYFIYSLDLKNSLAMPPITKVTSVTTTNINGTKEPISILDYRMYPPNSPCIKNLENNTISCTSNFEFLNSTNGFMQMLLKINRFPSDLYNTSTLFTVDTDQGKVECAPMLMLDQSLPINSDSPISWKTKFAEISARHFSIMIGGNKFFLGKEPISIHSDGYDDGSDNTYATLESTWYEDGFGYETNHPLDPVEMRMYMYFKREAGLWKLTELRTYDGEKRGEWLYYSVRGGAEVIAPVGDFFNDNLVFAEKNGRDAQIICNGCNISAFMDLGTTTDQKFSINSSADSKITITDEPGTWFNIKVGLQSSTPYNANEIIYNWGYSSTNPFNVEYLDENKSSIRINAGSAGQVRLFVTAFQVKDNVVRQVATKDYDVNIIKSTTVVHASCIFANQPIISSQNSICCPGLSLVPSSDQQTDLAGYCIDKNSDQTQYDKLQSELDSVKERLAVSEKKQSVLERLFADLQSVLARIMRSLRLPFGK